MDKHVLMTYATRRPYHSVPALPPHTQYDPVKGYWLKNGAPLVIADKSLGGGLLSKKCDQETGEDQKGE